METLKIWRTHPLIKLPAKQTEQSACFDLSFQGHGHNNYTGYTRMNKEFKRVMNNMIMITPGERVMVPTGISMDIPKGYSVRIHPRSGLSLKQGLVLANGEGVVDSDYVEEVMILVHNISDNNIEIRSGDRIAQAELVKDVEYSIEETSVRPGVKTSRMGGMGSTGIASVGDTITITVAQPKLPKVLRGVTPTKETKKEKVVTRGRGRPKKSQ